MSTGPCAVFAPLTGSPPWSAQAVRVEQEQLWVQLPSTCDDVTVGTRVIVEGPWSVRVVGTVEAADGVDVRICAVRAIHKDRRAAPRAVGGLDVSYAVATDRSEVDAWMARGELPVGSSWHAPDPFMSFSATGLEFEHRAIVDAGELLMLRLSLPGQKDAWRATARVVRVREIEPALRASFSPDEPAATHRVAIHFDAIANEARDALVVRGLEVMRARSRT